jgi:translation initiation factor 1 (eIF-1/SUI1)
VVEDSAKLLLKKLKKMLSCNGHIDAEKNLYVFQGDHRVTIKKYVIDIGVNKDLIIESGTG